MILGISGKKNSGKDTVGKIIQYLTWKDNLPDEDKKLKQYDFDYFVSLGNHIDNISPWKIKKFAGKLKDIICLLIGCTREQLEDENFKNKELGKQWNRTVWHIQSNYNRLETYNTKEEAEADLNHYDENYNQEVYVASEDIIITPRLMLQLLGTECGRNIIHPEIWINSLMADYINEVLRYNQYNDMWSFNKDATKESKWLVTDVRFTNEAEAIKKKGGLLIRVESKRCNYYDIHPSEIALDNYDKDKWDKVIFNDGSIEDLIKEVKKFLIKKEIIYETK